MPVRSRSTGTRHPPGDRPTVRRSEAPEAQWGCDHDGLEHTDHRGVPRQRRQRRRASWRRTSVSPSGASRPGATRGSPTTRPRPAGWSPWWCSTAS